MFLTLILNANFAFSKCKDNPLSQQDNCIVEFKPRSSEQCTTINSDMVNWYVQKEWPDTDTYRSTGSFYSQSPVDLKVGPVRNQGDIGWCFAYVAADLISEKIGEYISAAHIAKNYYKKSIIARLYNRTEGGYTFDAIANSLNEALCTEETLPSNQVDLNNFKKITCTQPTILFQGYKPKFLTAEALPGGSSLFPALDDELNKSPLVGINYNADTVHDSKTGIFNNHTASIVARYYDATQKSCQYIIRNSYGTLCSGDCKGGYYSVSEKSLNAGLTQIIILTKETSD